MARHGVALSAGEALPVVAKRITQEQLQRYADASGDHNPLHLDPEFAAKTQFGGTIAHGMLVLAFVSEMLTAAFGRAWLDSGGLKIRFRGPARPGDEVEASGRVTKVEGERVTCEIECRTRVGEVLVSGEAEVTVA
ncbi:MAG TPA: MaoC/PaaZ C-terminal domain-containing protein [Dehalococcoidia bacterium]|nr:MaoC/PaaZ C-terminal domain-containing protein [Dehalococcoidia bacterium]